jgi:hypothetical protein
MAYVKPQVLVFQEFTIVPAELTEPLRAHISGPNAILHRYSNADEKALINLGAYDPSNDTTYLYPQRTPGGVVDNSYVKLFADNALLRYFAHDGSDTTTVISPVSGKRNRIVSTATEGGPALRFKSNGATVRSSVFNQRDVKVGDVAHLRGVIPVYVGQNIVSCTEVTLNTTVAGFASDTVASAINAAVADEDNADNDLEGNTFTNHGQIAGFVNCLTIATSDISVSGYDGTVDGVLDETYTIEVIKSSMLGCPAVSLRVRSASGLDDVAELPAATAFNEVAIGTRGLLLNFSTKEGNPTCGAAAIAAGLTPDGFIVGQKWSVSVSQAYVPVAATSNTAGTYTGEYNDTYVIECVKGGYTDGGDDDVSFPQMSVRTVKGRDYSPVFEVVGTGIEFPIGRYGVTVAFSAGNSLPFTMNSTVPSASRIAKGDKWYVSVVSSSAGAVSTLILRDDLPEDMRDLTELDLSLFIKDDIQVSANRLSTQSDVNYELESTQVIVKEGITAYHPEWTAAGVEQPLELRGGTLYLEYREWVANLVDTVGAISTVADLDKIPGQLDVDNPLKWGVYKALTNSNGTVVKYTAVSEPDDLDSWVSVLARVKGRDDVYNLVPMTFNREVQNLYSAHIDDESNEIANNWKAGFVGVQSRSSKLVVGEGAAIDDVSGNTMDIVLATVTDNDTASGTQYTLLSVPAGNGNFITNNVQPGDIVRHSYITNGFGEETYSESVVDTVLSESSLLLYTALDSAINQAQRVEIWHNFTRNEVADDVAATAASFASRRICAVWPDQVGASGVMQPGYYLAAALAGFVSGVVPHQGLTSVEVKGFDDYSRSYKLFNETQLNRMAEAGVWIVTEDRDGTPYTRHALTTSTVDLNRREEMIRRNVDSISYYFLRQLRPYIGRTNATPGMVSLMRDKVLNVISFLKSIGYTAELGGQLIDGTIRTLRIHPLLKDRVELVLDLVVPAPLNNIEVHLVV